MFLFVTIEGIARLFVEPRGSFIKKVDELVVFRKIDFTSPVVRPVLENDRKLLNVAVVGDSYVDGMGSRTWADYLPVVSYSVPGAQPRHYVEMVKKALNEKNYTALGVSVYLGNDINVPNLGGQFAWETNAGLVPVVENQLPEKSYENALSFYMKILNTARMTSFGTCLVNLAANIAPKFGSSELVNALSEIKNMCEIKNVHMFVIVFEPPPSMRTKQNTYESNLELFFGYDVTHVELDKESFYNPRPDDHLNYYGHTTAADIIYAKNIDKVFK